MLSNIHLERLARRNNLSWNMLLVGRNFAVAEPVAVVAVVAAAKKGCRNIAGKFVVPENSRSGLGKYLQAGRATFVAEPVAGKNSRDSRNYPALRTQAFGHFDQKN